jgi:trk/ktr system potassium uptake protein
MLEPVLHAVQRRRRNGTGARNRTREQPGPMYAIVIGGGKVGYFLSRDLLERGDEVTLVEKDGSRADWLESQLGSIVMRGDGDEMAFLRSTGIERADAVLAVTGDDEDNLVALQLAKKEFNVPLTIARVNNPANVEIFKALGVDEAVSATEVLLSALERTVTDRQ